MAGQEQSPTLGVALQGMPRDGEVVQQHSVVALSTCEALLDVFNFRAEVYETER